MRLYSCLLSIYACKQLFQKRGPSNIDLSDMFEDDELEDEGATGEEDDLTKSEFVDEEDNFNIGDLQYSDEELC